MSMRFVRRGAFTLVELLVAMSLIVVLASLTLLVVVNMGERDGTTDAAGLTRQWLMIAKNRASRDHAPRGLRLIIGTDPNNVAKTSPYWVTECQYIEAPPIIITYPSLYNTFAPTGAATDPTVLFTYTLSPSPPPMGFPQAGTVINKQCQIVNLRYADVAQLVFPGNTTAIQPNQILQLPVIGSWHRIMSGTLSPALNAGNPGPYTVTIPFTGLDTWPDSQMGAAGENAGACYRTQLFGITSPPRPLMGEPPLQLPKNICIDLTPSLVPPGAPPPSPPYIDSPSLPQGAVGVDYDILFAPNGNVLPVAAGLRDTIYLWHRDYTKLRNNAPNGNNALVVTNNGPFPPNQKQYDMYPFQNGGEQQIVAIRCKTGSLGQFPVLWPNANGFYTPGDTPHALARFGATAP